MIFDSSTLISLSNACLIDAVRFLHRRGARFFMPQSVVEESINRPLHASSRMHQFSAMTIKRLVDDGVVEVDGANGDYIMEWANKIFFVRGKPIHLVDKGEADALALALDMGDKIVGIDERTTTSLIENPESLRTHLEKEFKTHVMFNEDRYNQLIGKLQKIGIVRSTELLAFAYEQGFMDQWRNKREALIAALYRLKYNGCGVTIEELDEYQKLF